MSERNVQPFFAPDGDAHGTAEHAADHAHEAVDAAHGAVDAAHGAAGHGAHGDAFDFTHLLHHLEDVVILPLPTFSIGGIEFDLSITKLILMMWIAGIISLVAFTSLAKNIAKGGAPKGLMANLFESLFNFIRQDMVYDIMGSKTGRAFAPFFITLFFFILFSNLLGLIPFMATATANLSVAAGLALMTFAMTQVNAVRSQGLLGYAKHHVPSGMPIFILPIMIPIELLGHLIRPFALTIRLFANMTGGHVVILSFFGLVFLFKSIILAPFAVGFVVLIDFLELLVAFLQAYVFVLLSILFVNSAVHPEH